jgi:large subunit ribosomal protein L4
MATLVVYDRSGAEVGTYEIDPAEIAPKINKQLLHDAVVMYQANARQGTHQTKSRGEVAGSTKKMYRQKGTGNARAGSRRSGIRRGGGHIFARRNRDYSYRMPKKMLRLATRMALASKIQDGELVLLNDLVIAAPKTREVVATLKSLGLAGVRTLVATEGLDLNVYKSARNIPGVSVSPVSDLNAFAILGAKKFLVTRHVLDVIRERLRQAGHLSGSAAADAVA